MAIAAVAADPLGLGTVDGAALGGPRDGAHGSPPTVARATRGRDRRDGYVRPRRDEGEEGTVVVARQGVEEAFDAVVAAADYPVWVVTTVADGVRAGCLVGFGTQVSIEPRRFLVGLSKKNHTYRVAADAEYLAVHLLASGQQALARLFATESGDTVDKFAHCAWTPGPHEVPVLTGASGWFAGRILERHDFGDHCGLLLEPLAGRAPVAGPALRYDRVAGLRPGHEA
ncbi:flavin reductase family protein [Nocardia farcinica]|uniref:flavin reductase family protein n=1 Tax=Nocardia farcinica TaxID=37329 RepID=UPI00313AB710